MQHESNRERAYQRALPDRGFVAIDVHVVRSLLRRRTYVGELTVERREPSRRSGHAPPIINVASGPSLEYVLRKLLPAAQCNPAIGAALQRVALQR